MLSPPKTPRSPPPALPPRSPGLTISAPVNVVKASPEELKAKLKLGTIIQIDFENPKNGLFKVFFIVFGR